MARLKLPAGVGSVAFGKISFQADANGIIDTGDTPSEIVQTIMAHTGAREATAEDEAAADKAEAAAQAEKVLTSEKDDLLTKLKALGVNDVDGRKSLAALRARLATALAAKQEDDATAAAQAAAQLAADNAAIAAAKVAP